MLKFDSHTAIPDGAGKSTSSQIQDWLDEQPPHDKRDYPAPWDGQPVSKDRYVYCRNRETIEGFPPISHWEGDCGNPVHLLLEHGSQQSAVYISRKARVRCGKCWQCEAYRKRKWTARSIAECEAAPRSWLLTHTNDWAALRFEYGLGDMGIPEDLDARITRREITKFFKRLRKLLKKSADPSRKFRRMTVLERHKSGLRHGHTLIVECDRPISQWELVQASFRLPRGYTRPAKPDGMTQEDFIASETKRMDDESRRWKDPLTSDDERKVLAHRPGYLGTKLKHSNRRRDHLAFGVEPKWAAIYVTKYLTKQSGRVSCSPGWGRCGLPKPLKSSAQQETELWEALWNALQPAEAGGGSDTCDPAQDGEALYRGLKSGVAYPDRLPVFGLRPNGHDPPIPLAQRKGAKPTDWNNLWLSLGTPR